MEELFGDEALRRREFLQRTALGAGLAASLATLLPADTLVAEAALAQRRTALPAPRNLPVDTFVVLMMENRSFDHYLGWLPGADGHQSGLQFTDRTQLNDGRCDGFLRSGDNDVFAISYYAEDDLGFIGHAAKAFTTFDRFHCSLMGSTLPNREYMWAAQSYGNVDNALPPQTPDTAGFPDTTIFAALDRAGVSNRYFFNDVPISALWGASRLAASGPIAEYYARAASGTLPHVSYVDPNFGGSAGEEPGLSGDEHPHGDVRTGQAFMADVVHAFMESPQWERGALFIVYDEWGGFFDHVRPPRVPDDRNDPDVDEDFGLMGFRIPAIAISPWVRRGHVAHTSYGFESILKLIEYRFGLGPLTRRDRHASNIGRSFDWASKPVLDLPDLPRPEHVVSMPCPGAMPGGVRAKDHDVLDLVSSGYLDGLGFEYGAATADSTFREPSKVQQAHIPALGAL